MKKHQNNPIIFLDKKCACCGREIDMITEYQITKDSLLWFECECGNTLMKRLQPNKTIAERLFLCRIEKK